MYKYFKNIIAIEIVYYYRILFYLNFFFKGPNKP